VEGITTKSACEAADDPDTSTGKGVWTPTPCYAGYFAHQGSCYIAGTTIGEAEGTSRTSLDAENADSDSSDGSGTVLTKPYKIRPESPITDDGSLGSCSTVHATEEDCLGTDPGQGGLEEPIATWSTGCKPGSLADDGNCYREGTTGGEIDRSAAQPVCKANFDGTYPECHAYPAPDVTFDPDPSDDIDPKWDDVVNAFPKKGAGLGGADVDYELSRFVNSKDVYDNPNKKQIIITAGNGEWAHILTRGGYFAAYEQVELWVFSDPTYIRTVNASATGDIDEKFALPLELDEGPHHIVLQGLDGVGSHTALQMAALVNVEVPPTGPGCSKPQYTTQDTCVAGGGVWTPSPANPGDGTGTGGSGDGSGDGSGSNGAGDGANGSNNGGNGNGSNESGDGTDGANGGVDGSGDGSNTGADGLDTAAAGAAAQDGSCTLNGASAPHLTDQASCENASGTWNLSNTGVPATTLLWVLLAMAALAGGVGALRTSGRKVQ
jgi:hypothetical protein